MMTLNRRNRSHITCHANRSRVESLPEKSMFRLIAIVLSIGAVFMCLGAGAEPVAAQENSALPGARPVAAKENSALPGAGADTFHYITGFRSAKWGMDEGEVRQAIAADFQIPDTSIGQFTNPDEATTVLVAELPSLSPGPGPAAVYYVFGATSNKLMHINVIWTTSDTPTDDERTHIAVAGMQLANYFSALRWKPDGAVTGVSLEPGEVLTFAGVDPDDAGVQVIVSGVPMTDADGNAIPPTGPAMLHISYSARFGAPDIVTVEPGTF